MRHNFLSSRRRWLPPFMTTALALAVFLSSPPPCPAWFSISSEAEDVSGIDGVPLETKIWFESDNPYTNPYTLTLPSYSNILFGPNTDGDFSYVTTNYTSLSVFLGHPASWTWSFIGGYDDKDDESWSHLFTWVGTATDKDGPIALTGEVKVTFSDTPTPSSLVGMISLIACGLCVGIRRVWNKTLILRALVTQFRQRRTCLPMRTASAPC